MASIDSGPISRLKNVSGILQLPYNNKVGDECSDDEDDEYEDTVVYIGEGTSDRIVTSKFPKEKDGYYIIIDIIIYNILIRTNNLLLYYY